MIARRRLERLLIDRKGATVIEFAILAPAVIAMILGVLAIGIQMQASNALRSIAADLNRYTVVEYQKANVLSTSQIEEVASAIAVNAPYRLSGEQFDVEVSEVTSPLEGAKKFAVVMTYTPFNALKIVDVQAATLTYRQNIFVPL